MMVTLTHDLVRAWMLTRPEDAHKGTFGHVLILAGSRGFTGAARLAAEGALRSGVGLVTVGIPQTLGDVVATGLIEAMTLPLPFTGAETFAAAALEPALAFAERVDAVVLGPGISQHPETRGFARAFAGQCPVPLVIDADGLNNLAGALDQLEVAAGPRLLTPHPGEMARLIGGTIPEVQQDREGTVLRFIEDHPCVLVLKGEGTVVAGPGTPCYRNTTGNSGMATGGTGDVLAGLIGGLLAQGMPGHEAGALGVYLHGLAGDLAARAKTRRAMLARDLADALPDAWAVLEEGDSCGL